MRTGVLVLLDGTTPLMILNVKSAPPGFTPKARVLTSELSGIVRPSYLQDLTAPGVIVNHKYTISLSQDGKPSTSCGYWMGTGSDCGSVVPYGLITPSPASASCPFGQFVGQRGVSPAPYISAGKLVTYVGAVNEWTIYGLGSAKHPL
jgi:hypothetical protein